MCPGLTHQIRLQTEEKYAEREEKRERRAASKAFHDQQHQRQREALAARLLENRVTTDLNAVVVLFFLVCVTPLLGTKRSRQ